MELHFKTKKQLSLWALLFEKLGNGEYELWSGEHVVASLVFNWDHSFWSAMFGSSSNTIADVTLGSKKWQIGYSKKKPRNIFLRDVENGSVVEAVKRRSFTTYEADLTIGNDQYVLGERCLPWRYCIADKNGVVVLSLQLRGWQREATVSTNLTLEDGTAILLASMLFYRAVIVSSIKSYGV